MKNIQIFALVFIVIFSLNFISAQLPNLLNGNSELPSLDVASLSNNTYNINYSIGDSTNTSYMLNTGDTATGNYNFDSGTFFIDSSNNRIGIGTASPDSILDIEISGTPIVYFRTTASSSQDAELHIRGSRTTGTGDLAELYFENNANSDVILGKIIGANADTSSLTDNGKLRFYTNDGSSVNLAMSINDLQNIGIGTDSPNALLELWDSGEVQLNFNSADTQIYRIFTRTSDDVFGIYDVTNSRTWFRYTGNSAIGSSKLVLMEGGGNVGIGTTITENLLRLGTTTSASDNDGTLAIKSDSSGIALHLEENNGAESWKIGVNVAGDLVFDDSNAGSTDVLFQDGTGFVGIGTTIPIRTLDVGGTQSSSTIGRIENRNTGTNADVLDLVVGQSNAGNSNNFITFWDNDGGTVIGQIEGNLGNTIAYRTTSDRRIKDNIRNTKWGLKDLLKIKVRDYEVDGETSTGFIAQELYKIYPLVVSVGDKGEINMSNVDSVWGVEYGKLTPLLIKSIQDQQEQIKLMEKSLCKLGELIWC